MRRLSAILLAFTIFSSTTPAGAGPFQHPAILGDTAAKLKPTPQPPDPKKLIEAQPLALAIKHCLILEGSITQQYKLIDAFNTQPDLDNLPKNINDTEREKIMLYLMGHPEIPNFGFLIPNTWKTVPRNLRLKWNSLTTLRLDESLGFRNNGYPFAGNCKGKMDSEIIKDKSNFLHTKITMPLAFDQTVANLAYVLSQQPGYNWQIDDLLVNDVGLGNYLDKELGKNINAIGLEQEIKLICKKSNFSNLQCN